MRITNNLYIKPLQINQQYANNNRTNSQNPIQNTSLKMLAYKDFMVNFTGRTPEDFYAQDFNRENMPQRMKNYLYYDYNQRQHIPPEQMMYEVFKYIKDAKTLEDVKNPDDPLFANLHEATKKSRTGILSEINIAKELSDAPLLKDGSDNFGLYLLKKIYLEGKTIKEISKDFYEKDLNDEFKGVITKPIDYSTTSAYGIRYPKTDFWNSFIATRDEYKKFYVTLPKDTVDPNIINVSKSSHSSSASRTSASDKTDEPVRRPRKFKIQKYKKDQIKKDIVKSNGSEEQIQRVIRKRFSASDPEASFIVKYLSPIMIIAADKIHLSEEEKAFAAYEKNHGQFGKGKCMFERF